MKHAFALAIALSTAIASSGCATFKNKPKDTQSKEEIKEEDKLPFLTRPEVKTLWIPDSIEGNRYIEGHRVFVIDKNSSWSKE